MLLNADLGESWYDRKVGDDAQLMPFLDLCNVACGFHGGDALTQLKTIRLARKHGVKIGAHPSFPDRKNFGRTVHELPAEQLEALLFYQIGGFQALVGAEGQFVYHLKPHGALYHYANQNAEAAASLARVATELQIPTLVGPPRGALREAAQTWRLDYLAESFADRAYETAGSLRSRKKDHAILHKWTDVAAQVTLLKNGRVRTTDGSLCPLSSQTLCIHGDHPGAAARAAKVRALLGQ